MYLHFSCPLPILIDDRHPRMSIKSIPTESWNPKVLGSFAILLSKASPLYTLYSILRDHTLETAADHDDAAEWILLTRFVSAMEAYVQVGLFSEYCFPCIR